MNESELIAAIQAARNQGLDPEDGYLTTRELRQITGLGEDAMLNVLRHYKEAGRLETKRVLREGIAGLSRVPAYKIA